MSNSETSLTHMMNIAMVLDSTHLYEGTASLASFAIHISSQALVNLFLFASNSINAATRADLELSIRKLNKNIAVTWATTTLPSNCDRTDAVFRVLRYFCGKKVLIISYDVLFFQDILQWNNFFSDITTLSGITDFDSTFRSDAAYLSGNLYINASLLWANLSRLDPHTLVVLQKKAESVASFPGADCRDVLNRAFQGHISAVRAFWEPHGRSSGVLRLVCPGRQYTNRPAAVLYPNAKKNLSCKNYLAFDRMRLFYIRKTHLYTNLTHCKWPFLDLLLLWTEAVTSCTRVAKYIYQVALKKHIMKIISKLEYSHAVTFRSIRNRLLELNAKEKAKTDYIPPSAVHYDTVVTFEDIKVMEGIYGIKHTYSFLFSVREITEFDTACLLHGKNAAIFHVLRNTKIKNQISILLFALENIVNLYFVETGLACCISNIHCKNIPFRFRRNSSYIVDDMGFYFDAMIPTRLESYLNSDFSSLCNKKWARAMCLKDFLVRHKISKYNYQPITPPPCLRTTSSKILVVDQSKSDASITRGGANEKTFRNMLEAALQENPNAEIFIKTHPDSVRRGRGAYFAEIVSEGRIHKISESINPYSILDHVDIVYVCTSILGLEALLCNKEVHVFGMPVYAGWGLTHDRQSVPRRTRKLSLTELIHALYIQFSVYFDPYTGERVEVEDYLESMLKLREEYYSIYDRESFHIMKEAAKESADELTRR